MLAEILAARQKVVLVDLPIPRWHSSASPLLSDYPKHKQKVLRKFQHEPGFYYVKMQDMNRDDDFCDEVHPRPRVTIQWAERLAGALSPVLAGKSTE